jgi:hypothetical protein
VVDFVKEVGGLHVVDVHLRFTIDDLPAEQPFSDARNSTPEGNSSQAFYAGMSLAHDVSDVITGNY